MDSLKGPANHVVKDGSSFLDVEGGRGEDKSCREVGGFDLICCCWRQLHFCGDNLPVWVGRSQLFFDELGAITQFSEIFLWPVIVERGAVKRAMGLPLPARQKSILLANANY